MAKDDDDGMSHDARTGALQALDSISILRFVGWAEDQEMLLLLLLLNLYR